MNVDGFKIHDLVWAKMKGYPPWPGMVVNPSEDIVGKRYSPTMHCVYFFGSNNYSWLEEKYIKPYEDFKEAYSTISKLKLFTEAVEAIDDYIKSGAKGVPVVSDKIKKRPSVNGSSPGEKPEFVTPKEIVRKRKAVPMRVASEEKFPKTPRVKGFGILIDRPPRTEPEVVVTDVKAPNQNLIDKKITPTSMTIGFLGLGIMGSRVAKNILQSGHKVMVWNRTPSKSDQFLEAGAEVGMTPADVVQRSDITFSCVSDPQAAKELVFGNCGVLSEMNSEKGFVELTSVDADTSKDIADSIHGKGGRYLEAQMSGSLSEAEEGKLLLLCAGDESLFKDCQTCFRSCSDRTPYYLGPTGSACNMNLVMQSMQGIMIAALAEGCSFMQKMGIRSDIFREILKWSDLESPLYVDKIKMIMNENFATSQPLQHHQKDLKLALTLGDQVDQSMPLTATTNELYKHARRLGFGGHDTSSVYVRTKY